MNLNELMSLYMQLHNNPMPDQTEEIIPNLTHGQRPYAFIENVITDANYRKRGLANAYLDYAKEIAKKKNCYKMMLLTGSKEESTLKFYGASRI